MSSAARWAWAKTRGMTSSDQPAAMPAAWPHRPARFGGDHPDQEGKDKRGGEPTREHVQPRGVRAVRDRI